LESLFEEFIADTAALCVIGTAVEFIVLRELSVNLLAVGVFGVAKDFGVVLTH